MGTPPNDRHLVELVKIAVGLLPEGETLHSVFATNNPRPRRDPGLIGYSHILVGTLDLRMTTIRLDADGACVRTEWQISKDPKGPGHGLKELSRETLMP